MKVVGVTVPQDEHFEFNFAREKFDDPNILADDSKPNKPRWDMMDRRSR